MISHGSTVLIGLLLLALYGWQLGSAPLFDVDEGAFAQASLEMLISGDWGHTTLNGNDRFDKPILIYWLQALSLHLFGINEFAVRLPSALALLLAAGGIGRFCAQRWGQTSGLRAALLLGTTAGFLIMGRASTADGLLNALLALTGIALWGFLEKGDRSALRWAYFLCGLGLLTKGPVAVLIPGAAVVIWSLSIDRGRRFVAALSDLQGWLVLLLTALPWYVYAWARHGQAFIDGFFLKHNVQRFAAPLEGHDGGLAYYALVLPILLLPWTPLVIGCALRIRSQGIDALDRYLWIWALFVIGFFSLAGTKLPHYALYAATPLVLLAARHWTADRSWVRLGLWLCLILQCLLTAGLALFVTYEGALIPDPWIQSLLAQAPSAKHVLTASAFCIFGVLLCMGLRRRWPDRSLFAATIACSLLWTSTLVPWIGETLQGPFRNAGRWAKAQELQLNLWRMNVPSVSFYSGRPTVSRPVQPGDWVLQRADRPLPETHQAPASFFDRGLSIIRIPE